MGRDGRWDIKRRLRLDLLFAYKILFGLVDINWSDMFVRNEQSITRGHCYKLYAKTSRIDVRQTFFATEL
jgi:hypothetical protein